MLNLNFYESRDHGLWLQKSISPTDVTSKLKTVKTETCCDRLSVLVRNTSMTEEILPDIALHVA